MPEVRSRRVRGYPSNSPRIGILRGLCIEAKDLNLAYKYPADLLQEDESNAVRFIAPLCSSPILNANFRPFIGGMETTDRYSTRPEQIRQGCWGAIIVSRHILFRLGRLARISGSMRVRSSVGDLSSSFP